MPNVQFDDGGLSAERFAMASARTPALVAFLLKTGLVKSARQANYALIFVVLCVLLLTAYIVKTSFFKTRTAVPLPSGLFPNGVLPGAQRPS